MVWGRRFKRGSDVEVGAEVGDVVLISIGIEAHVCLRLHVPLLLLLLLLLLFIPLIAANVICVDSGIPDVIHGRTVYDKDGDGTSSVLVLAKTTKGCAGEER